MSRKNVTRVSKYFYRGLCWFRIRQYFITEILLAFLWVANWNSGAVIGKARCHFNISGLRDSAQAQARPFPISHFCPANRNEIKLRPSDSRGQHTQTPPSVRLRTELSPSVSPLFIRSKRPGEHTQEKPRNPCGVAPFFKEMKSRKQ